MKVPYASHLLQFASQIANARVVTVNGVQAIVKEVYRLDRAGNILKRWGLFFMVPSSMYISVSKNRYQWDIEKIANRWGDYNRGITHHFWYLTLSKRGEKKYLEASKPVFDQNIVRRMMGFELDRADRVGGKRTLWRNLISPVMPGLTIDNELYSPPSYGLMIRTKTITKSYTGREVVSVRDTPTIINGGEWSPGWQYWSSTDNWIYNGGIQTVTMRKPLMDRMKKLCLPIGENQMILPFGNTGDFVYEGVEDEFHASVNRLDGLDVWGSHDDDERRILSKGGSTRLSRDSDGFFTGARIKRIKFEPTPMRSILKHSDFIRNPVWDNFYVANYPKFQDWRAFS